MKRDLLSPFDLSREEAHRLIDRARDLKAALTRGESTPTLRGKHLGMIFERASTRTRVSFEVGMTQLGGHAVLLTPHDTQIGRGEIVPDTARVLSRYLDAIMARTAAHDTVVELAEWAEVPVINGLSNLHHPCQVLADLMTVAERRGSAAAPLAVAFVGDGNNVANSWIALAAVVGFACHVATPPGYEPDADVVAQARRTGRGLIEVSHDPIRAVEAAEVIYTDVWASMGQEAEADSRAAAMRAFQVNDALLARARPDAIVMHCLPAHRGEEITADVLEGPRSVVWEQAENRLHLQKALLELLLA